MIPEAGAYKIALDVRSMTIAIEPFTPYTQLWMVGDATPAGWNIDDPTPLEPVAGDPYTFVYHGPLQVGELKFPVTTGDWGADYFMPGINYQPLESEYVRFIPRGDPDHKWMIEEAGNYRITLD